VIAGRRARPIVMAAILLAVALFAIAPPFASEFLVIVLTQCLIWAILAMSLDLMLGYTGLASLGHAAYFGSGAYAAAIATAHFKASFVAALGAALLVAAAVTAVFALVALRAAGVYFLIITFALAMLLWGLAYRWNTMTGGENGIAGIQRPALLGGSLAYHYFVLAVFALVVLFFVVLVRSAFGRSLVGIRESEARMRTLGYNVWLHKYIVYMISGVVSGLAGFLWTFYNGYVAPSDIELATSFNALLMVSLGGAGTLVGPILGSTIFVLLHNLVNLATDRWLTIVGLVYIAVVLFAPEGLMGLWGRRLQEAREPGGAVAGTRQ
jgi:branched-chain amino acid transport system permease protein